MVLSLAKAAHPISRIDTDDESRGTDVSETENKYWYNLSTRAVEQGYASPAVDRVGPFDTAEEAANAPELLKQRSRAWADDDARDDAWGASAPGTDPERH
jgi:hypothetical protein